MATKMKTYQIEVNGIKHTVQMTEEDAAHYKTAKEVPPATKAVTPANK